MEIVNGKQEALLSATEVNADIALQLFQSYIARGDYTLALEQENEETLYISLDKNLFTLLLQLGADEFYDYISTPYDVGKIEFIQGGQLVFIDKKYLADESGVKQAIERFAENSASFRTDSQWQLQL